MRIGIVLLGPALLGALALAAGCASSPAVITVSGAPTVSPAPPAPCQKAPIRVAVGAFDTGNAPSGDIGEGLAAMLAGALGNNTCFLVSPAEPSTAQAAVAAGQNEGAQLLILGSVGEFQAPCKGGSLIVLAGNQACVAVNLRIVDAASGQPIHSITASGDSAAAGAGLSYARAALPPALAAYTGTPIEQALRNCVEQAVGGVAYWYLTEQP